MEQYLDGNALSLSFFFVVEIPSFPVPDQFYIDLGLMKLVFLF